MEPSQSINTFESGKLDSSVDKKSFGSFGSRITNFFSFSDRSFRAIKNASNNNTQWYLYQGKIRNKREKAQEEKDNAINNNNEIKEQRMSEIIEKNSIYDDNELRSFNSSQEYYDDDNYNDDYDDYGEKLSFTNNYKNKKVERKVTPDSLRVSGKPKRQSMNNYYKSEVVNP